MTYSIAMLLILVAMVFALLRAMLGPSVYDRILALNSFGTLAALMIAVYVFVMEQPDFLVIALLYVLINFIGPIAVLRFLERGAFSDAQGDEVGARE